MKKLILAILYIILITAVALSLLNQAKENTEVQSQPEVTEIRENPQMLETIEHLNIEPIQTKQHIQVPVQKDLIEEPIDWVKAEPKGCPYAEQLTADDPKCILAM